MSTPIQCKRTNCVNNLNGQCTFEAPQIYRLEAYTQCLDQTNKTDNASTES